jgi:protein SCO1/2
MKTEDQVGRTGTLGRRGVLAVVAGLVALATVPGQAQRAEPLPEDLEGVQIEERHGAQLPLDLTFANENGERVELGRYFDEAKPVILVFAYYRCPMLCTYVLNGMIDALRELEWIPGQELEVVVVSIDAREGPELAREKKENYLSYYQRPSAREGFHLLTGEEEEIRELADAAGFHFRYVPEQDQFAHGAAIMIVTPEGKISQVLKGVQFEPQTLRLALIDASGGSIGSVMDRAILYCFQYDAEAGRYTPAVRQLVKIGAVLTMGVLGAFLLIMWRRDSRRRGRPAPDSA